MPKRIPKIPLDHLTYMVVLLRHSEQVLRVRTGSTCECDGQFTQAQNLCPGGLELACRPLWHLASSSLPLPAAGPNRRCAAAGSRGQGRLYREIARFLDPTSSAAGSARTRGHQPVGGSVLATLLEPASRPWLNARTSAKSVAKINTCMIVSHLKNYRRFITGWCPMKRRTNPPPS